MTIAALYVERDGGYFGLPQVDAWDESRDARFYQGPHPVVAHPPCHLWGNFAFVNFKRWGGEHNQPGNDGGCFRHALECVRAFGGVLEHPAFSRAWGFYGLIPPKGLGWMLVGSAKGGNEWVCEVWQNAYGHPARKRTWLLYVGMRAPKDLIWDRRPATHQIGFHDQRGPERNKKTISGKAASRTPPAFRDALIRLAQWSKP